VEFLGGLHYYPAGFGGSQAEAGGDRPADVGLRMVLKWRAAKRAAEA
jgi:hypothetical protein